MSGIDGLRLDDQLCFALYAATNAVTRAYRPLLRALGLTYPQYLVMLTLWQDGERSIHEIAYRLYLPPNALTPLIDRLETGGLIRRMRDTQDRRIIRIALTAEGAALEQAASLAQRKVACRTGLGQDGLAALREELRMMVDRMEDSATDQA